MSDTILSLPATRPNYTPALPQSKASISNFAVAKFMRWSAKTVPASRH